MEPVLYMYFRLSGSRKTRPSLERTETPLESTRGGAGYLGMLEGVVRAVKGVIGPVRRMPACTRYARACTAVCVPAHDSTRVMLSYNTRASARAHTRTSGSQFPKITTFLRIYES